MRNEIAAALLACMEQPEELSAAGQIALHCWAFCEGWAPERWPVYNALYPVPDWHHTIELMRAIRSALQPPKPAQESE